MTVVKSDPLLDPARLTAYLRAHRLPPLERFGQHFLVDAEILDAIVRASETDPAIPVIEIGAGLGVLTRALARARGQGTGNREQSVALLIATEIDRRLIPLLKERMREFPSVHVANDDILKASVEGLLLTAHCSLPTPYDVIGNIPYNITAPIFRKFLNSVPRPRRLTFLLDQAVAQTIAAEPPRMSIRAVSVQVFAEPRIVRDRIPPSAFVPPPEVSSAILTLSSRPHPLVLAEEEQTFFRLVRAGFSQKRKTLANALAAAYHLAPADAAARLRRARIEPSRRAQTLSIPEWKELLHVWDSRRGAPPRAPRVDVS